MFAGLVHYVIEVKVGSSAAPHSSNDEELDA